MKRELNLKLTGITVSGTATLNLWGGGSGTIEMQPYTLPIDKATKDNILRCVNDNGFGCESIGSAEIDIQYNYEGTKKYERTLFVSHPIHSKLFLGWQELRKQGIKIF